MKIVVPLSVRPTALKSWFPRLLCLSGPVFLFLLLACLPAQAASYYVATNGFDSYPGTLSQPFRTISRSTQSLAQGDVCYIRGGIYRETLQPNNSGSQGHPITFTAYSNEVVTISGCDLVTNWSLSSGSIYSASMNWDLGMGFNQVFVDGAMMSQERYPAVGATNILLNPPLANCSNTAGSTNVISSSSFTAANGSANWMNGNFIGRIGYSWTWQWGQITAVANGSVTVNPEPNGPWFISGQAGYNGAGYILENNLAGLTAARQWHFQNNTLYLWTPAGDSPNNHLVEAKHRAWAVDFSSRSNIVVSGIHLFGGAVNMSGSACVLTNCEAAFLSHFILRSWSGYSIIGGASGGYQGIYVTGPSNVIAGCYIHDTAASGIAVTGRGNLITRCSLQNLSYGGSYGTPVFLSGTANRVWFNTIANSGRDTLIPQGANQDIRFNDISFPSLLCHDVGVIYVFDTDALGSEPFSTRIAYNWLHDNGGVSGLNPGVYLDNYDRNFRVDHNVIWNCTGDAGVRLNGPDYGQLIYNNTLFNCDDVGSHTYMSPPPNPGDWVPNGGMLTAANLNTIDQYIATNNLFVSNNPTLWLVDFAHRNFQLRTNSTAINAGVVLPGYTDGYFGTAPDRGAYESGAFPWTAGTNGAVGVSLQPSGANFILSCPIGTLQQASYINGPWSPVQSATQPYTVTPVNAAKFYRVRVE